MEVRNEMAFWREFVQIFNNKRAKFEKIQFEFVRISSLYQIFDYLR